MSSKIKTYNPKEVIVTCGTHIVTGYADDSFISIEPNGDGITKKTGCDGEIARSISPDNTYKVKLTLLQTSDSNSYFSGMVDLDQMCIRDRRKDTNYQRSQMMHGDGKPPVKQTGSASEARQRMIDRRMKKEEK